MLKLASLLAALAFVFPPMAAAAPDSAAPAPPSASKPVRATSGVMRYDANGDGWVDHAEWNAGQEARFKELDTDRDGKLSKDELFARTPAAPGNVLPSDRQLQRQNAFFQRMDTDKDGFVSKAEFMAQAERNFRRCDLDRDGRINTAECRQALRRQPTQPASTDR
jgi:hypothetical protein